MTARILPYYAGIGSRDTPIHILRVMYRLGSHFADYFILRSGHALGADQAFETGCSQSNGGKEIFVPYRGYNGGNSDLTPSSEAYGIAAAHHPNWSTCNEIARKMHARNAHIILGKDLQHPVKFVVCWTRGGQVTGGTGQPIRMAQAHEIPVFNLADQDAERELMDFVGGLLMVDEKLGDVL